MRKIMKNRIFTLPLFLVVLFISCNFGLSNKTVEYKVSYYLQNIENDEYTLLESERFSGYEGEMTNISPKIIEGFTVIDFAQRKITDGMDFIIKYDRDLITCYFNFNGGIITLEDGTVIEDTSLTGRYGAKISVLEPEKTGYVLECWYMSDGTELAETFTKSGTYTASYISKSESTYTVHHFLQNIEDDDYKEDVEKLQVLSGFTGKKTEAQALEIEGFAVRAFEQKTVTSDGSTEISIYYYRKLITLTFNLSGGEGQSAVTKKYGTVVTVTPPVKSGAEFSGWTPDLPQTFKENALFTAVYDMPSYKVKYLFENLTDDEYSEDIAYPVETYLGTVGQITNITAKPIKGFVSQSIEQKTVLADNSTVVEVKYKRRLITIFIDLKNGVGQNFIIGKYCKESEIDISKTQVVDKLASLVSNDSEIPFSKTGNTFGNFSFDSELAFTLENNEKTAISVIWNGGLEVFYTINVYKEKVFYESDEDKYELSDVFYANGKSGHMSDLVLNENDDSISIGNKKWVWSGFTPLSYENQELAGNDSTIINLHFDRKEITYTYKLNGGKINNSTNDIQITGKYGTPVINPEPIKAGYSYIWKDSDLKSPGETYGLISTEYTANWNLKKYKVHRHFNGKIVDIDNVDVEWKITNFTNGTNLGTKSTSEKNEYDNIIGGWSLNPDCSTLDFENDDSCLFTLSDDISMQTEIDLYILWKSKYTINYYKEVETGIYKKEATNNLSTIYFKDRKVDATLIDYPGFFAYKTSPKVLNYDNSTVFDIFYTKHNLVDSVVGQVDIPVFITDNSDKKIFADIIKAKTTVPDAKVLASSDFDGKVFYDLSEHDGIQLLSKTVSLYAVKDGMYTSQCLKKDYDYYLGTKFIEDGVDLYDVCFNDGTCLPYTFYADENFSFTVEQKSGVKDIIFYKNTENSDLGARTLGIYVDSINKTKDAFYSTRSYDSWNVDGIWYTIGDYLKENPKDGSGLNIVFEGLSEEYKGYCWAYFHCIKPLSSFGNYYIPTFDEEAKLISNRTIINTALTKLSKNIINTNYYYLNTYHEKNLLDGGWKYYQSLLIKGDGTTKWEPIQKKTGYVLAIREY